MIGITQVLINDDSDRTVTGVIVYDRDSGGTLVIPAGTSFPLTDVTPGEVFFRTDLMVSFRRNDANDTWESSSAAPTAHAPTHIEGGIDPIDGDQLEIDFTPVNYSRDISPAQVDSVNQLTAHLKGIDDALTPVIISDLVTVSNLNVDTVTNEYDGGVGANDALFVRDTLTAVVVTAGTYRFDYTYLWNHDATNTDFIAQIKLDGNLSYFHRQEPKDSAGMGVGGTDQVLPCGGFLLFDLTPATYSFVFSFGTSNDINESTLLRSDLMFYRIS